MTAESVPRILNLPNALTIARILVVPVYVSALLYDYRLAALGLFAAASATDLLDGMLARRLDARTRFGEVIDPIADKLLLMSSFVIFTLLGWVPLWLTVTVLSRDIIVIAGTVIVYLVTDRLVVRVTRTGKATTAAQLLLLAYVLLRVNFGAGWRHPTLPLYLPVLALTVISGLQYIRQGLREVGGR